MLNDRIQHLHNTYTAGATTDSGKQSIVNAALILSQKEKNACSIGSIGLSYVRSVIIGLLADFTDIRTTLQFFLCFSFFLVSVIIISFLFSFSISVSDFSRNRLSLDFYFFTFFSST